MYHRLAEQATMEDDPWSGLADTSTVRDERHAAAVLHAQTQQFFGGLRSALGDRVSRNTSITQLLQAALGAAGEVSLEPGDTSAELFDLFIFMRGLADFPFDANYSAALAVDGSVTFLAGPELPRRKAMGLDFDDDHDAADLARATEIARRCTELAAELRFRLEHRSHAVEPADPQVETTQRPAASGQGAFLGELTRLAREHTQVWSGASEAAWLGFALQILDQAGLMSNADELVRARSVLRLMTLWALHIEFCAYSGEGSAGDWTYSISEWVDQGLSTRELSLLSDDLGLGFDPEDEDVLMDVSDVCADAVRSQRREVADALLRELGESGLVASLYAARRDVTYPLDTDELDDILNTDPNADKMQGFQWVSDGMDL